MSINVFISYAREDISIVKEIANYLIDNKIDVWLDIDALLPGQDWDYEIQKALKQARFVVVCLSTNSVDKTGYVQKELRHALDLLEYRPEGVVYLIPIRLDDCIVPTRLRAYNWLDWFNETNRVKLLKSLTFSS